MLQLRTFNVSYMSFNAIYKKNLKFFQKFLNFQWPMTPSIVFEMQRSWLSFLCTSCLRSVFAIAVNIMSLDAFCSDTNFLYIIIFLHIWLNASEEKILLSATKKGFGMHQERDLERIKIDLL